MTKADRLFAKKDERTKENTQVGERTNGQTYYSTMQKTNQQKRKLLTVGKWIGIRREYPLTKYNKARPQ